MGRLTYVCANCSEYFTRRYSAKRRNQNLHNGAAEIVRLIDYLAGRSSGHYTPNNPFWYKRSNPYNKIGPATVADILGDTSQSRYIPQQIPLDVSQDYASPICRPIPTMDRQSYAAGLSQGAMQKLKKLMDNHHIPDGVIRLAIFNSINGDNKLLDQMLDVAARCGTAPWSKPT